METIAASEVNEKRSAAFLKTKCSIVKGCMLGSKWFVEVHLVPKRNLHMHYIAIKPELYSSWNQHNRHAEKS